MQWIKRCSYHVFFSIPTTASRLLRVWSSDVQYYILEVGIPSVGLLLSLFDIDINIGIM